MAEQLMPQRRPACPIMFACRHGDPLRRQTFRKHFMCGGKTVALTVAEIKFRRLLWVGQMQLQPGQQPLFRYCGGGVFSRPGQQPADPRQFCGGAPGARKGASRTSPSTWASCALA